MFFGGVPEKEDLDNKGLYDCLEIPQDASDADIKKAYKKLALKHHPDKGGDDEKFKEISAAFEVLSDPEKRALYDEHGLEGLEDRHGGSPDDIFNMFFGGGRRKQQQGPSKGDDIVHAVKCSLEDLYNGKTVKLAISRKKPCADCGGKGGLEGAEKSCPDCRGQGIQVEMRQFGPGMIQQMQTPCSSCRQTGKIMEEQDRCKSCGGSKVHRDRKVVCVNIEKGMKDGSKIRFSGEADEFPGTIPGEIVIVVQEKEHEVFKRSGADLETEMSLTLSEALCGFAKTVTHLDGRRLKIESVPGEVIRHDQCKAILGEGMPLHGNPFSKGRLFVVFKVHFPKNLPVDAVRGMKRLLPHGELEVMNGEEEECSMEDIDISQFGINGAGGEFGAGNCAPGDSDEEENGEPHRVQCGQA